MAKIEQRIQNILKQLEETNEDLLALSDDIWLSIDHNDNESLEEGIRFKTRYNEKLSEFTVLSDQIESLVRNFTGLSREEEETAELETHENERIIKALDRRKKHFLDEDYRYKRPYGFTIQGKAYQNIRSWRKLYQLTLQYLYRNFQNFNDVLSNSRFVSNRGNKDFSSNKSDLRKAIKVIDSIYAEANLSANQIRDHIIKLLEFFVVDKKTFIIYLKEDRDWQG